MTIDVRIERIYAPAGPATTKRVLVDRLWPRGLRKADADLDLWCKDLAPSTALRTFYGHRAELFEEFARRYRTELTAPHAAVAVSELVHLSRTHPVVLLTATRDLPTSGAAVLGAYLSSQDETPFTGMEPSA